MVLYELILIAVGLAMDAFSVSVCQGLSMRKINLRQTFLIALFFGGFQALMPVAGWLLGKQFERYITNFDHWIAFILLALIGGKMLYDALRGGDSDSCGCRGLRLTGLLVLAVATSIDALAVGVTFAFLKTNIVQAAVWIGGITFMLSILGVWIGTRFGNKFEQKAQIAGGVILILIGLKILLEHLGLLPF